MQLPASSSMLALALLISGSTSHSVQSSGYTWVRGVNYVPSTSHNDVQTWQDYNSTLVEIELGYAAASGFNAVRVFLHSLPWIFNATAFSGHLRHFIQTAESLNLTSQLVIFDSCFGDVDANVSWITTGIYRNYTWIPNPGPAAVANSSSWPLYDEYATAVIDIVGSSSAVFLWDVMNEPAFSDGPQVVDFIEHMSALVASLDPLGRPRTVGIASSSQQSLVQDHVSLLSFHNYNGGGDGAALAQDIAGQQALGKELGLPVLLTESMSRPSDPLASVLPAVYGCFNASGSSSRVGWFVWELMLGVDQFNHDWTYPYQGLVYPPWAGVAGGGQWWDSAERSLLQSYVSSQVPPCPKTPGNGSFIPDTDGSLWSYAPGDAWTAWSGPGPRQGTLHYSNTAGAVATLVSPAPLLSNVSSFVLVVKIGPDCGKLAVTINGIAVATDVDTYSPVVNWDFELLLPLAIPAESFVVDVEVLGKANPASSNAWVQIVGAIVELSP